MRFRDMMILHTVHEESLLSRFTIRPLGHAHERHISEAQLLKLLVHLTDLAQSSVDQQEVRCWNLTVLDPRLAPLERLPKSSVVVARCDTRNVVSSVFFLQRTLGPEHNARCDGPLVARVTDIETLDSRRSLGKIELSSQGGEHLIHALLLCQPHP